MFGDQSFELFNLFGNSVRTNLEALLIIAATSLSVESLPARVMVVLSFSVGTALHLASHWFVAVAYGKGIDAMVLTRAGRIDYSGDPPQFVESVLRTLAGPAMNGCCALVSYLLILTSEFYQWHLVWGYALGTFCTCNLVLTAINFLPAIPFDGGLVLRVVALKFCGDRVGNQIAVWVSFPLLLGMVGVGLWFHLPLLCYIGLTIAYDNWRKHLRA